MVAAGLLTWMIFWMRTHGRQLQVELETRTAGALDGGGGFRGGLVAVAFVAVLREGIEAALFLVAAAIDSSGAQVLAGAAIGTARWPWRWPSPSTPPARTCRCARSSPSPGSC
ncbi:MAG: FTR1 family protein [Acidimicrobiales bacterium]